MEQRAAYSSLFDPYDTDIYHQVINSLESDQMMNYLRTTVCLTIARVIPDDDGERKQEMWVIKVNERRDIAVYGTRNEWKQVLQANELAKECGWATFLAQKAQEEHERRHKQIVEQFAPDHYMRIIRDPEYWRNLGYQECNNNRLLTEIVRIVKQLKNNEIDIIECSIQIGSYECMYYDQRGMFALPETIPYKDILRLHSMALGIPRINDSAYTCVPTPGQLFTNQWGDAPDWVLMPEGVFGATRTITPWPADCPYYPDSPEYCQPKEEDQDSRA